MYSHVWKYSCFHRYSVDIFRTNCRVHRYTLVCAPRASKVSSHLLTSLGLLQRNTYRTLTLLNHNNNIVGEFNDGLTDSAAAGSSGSEWSKIEQSIYSKLKSNKQNANRLAIITLPSTIGRGAPSFPSYFDLYSQWVRRDHPRILIMLYLLVVLGVYTHLIALS